MLIIIFGLSSEPCFDWKAASCLTKEGLNTTASAFFRFSWWLKSSDAIFFSTHEAFRPHLSRYQVSGYESRKDSRQHDRRLWELLKPSQAAGAAGGINQ